MSGLISWTMRADSARRLASSANAGAARPSAIATAVVACDTRYIPHLSIDEVVQYDCRMPARKKPVRRKKTAPASVGLSAAETRDSSGAGLDALASQIDTDGGAVLARYKDPFGAQPLL